MSKRWSALNKDHLSHDRRTKTKEWDIKKKTLSPPRYRWLIFVSKIMVAVVVVVVLVVVVVVVVVVLEVVVEVVVAVGLIK